MKILKLATSFAIALALMQSALASVGLIEIQGKNTDGPVTVFYPSNSEAKAVKRGAFTFELADQGEPKLGNRRLVVISHGSGGNPWVHAGLAQQLANEGFIVALPEHKGDNYKDPSAPGPESWTQRPLEVSRAIDTLTNDVRFASLLSTEKVGMFGMSAGGHTALTLAGGKWSAARLREHCEMNLTEDFQTCVGLTTRLTGGLLDGFKKTVALAVIQNKLKDATLQGHTDSRIAAIVAGVPLAADFDMNTLQAPQVPLGLVTAKLDKWLVPKFHSDIVLKICKPCEHLAHYDNGGHGALLSPPPPHLTGLLGDLINDPIGFDRTLVATTDLKIVDFFSRHLK